MDVRAVVTRIAPLRLERKQGKQLRQAKEMHLHGMREDRLAIPDLSVRSSMSAFPAPLMRFE